MAKANAKNSRVPLLDSANGGRTGFDRGFTVKDIIGATFRDNTIMFLVSWNGTEEIELIPSRTLSLKCPQLVIAFYEKRLAWSSDSTSR